MKKLLLVLTISMTSFSLHAETILCQVEVCNRIERFSINPMSHFWDSVGEQCFDITLPKKDAVVGKVLAADSRWYQGSFNPTKQSVTTIKSVHSCSAIK